MTDPVLAEVIDPSVLKARRAARAARDVADTLVDARREAIDAERSALAALRTAATQDLSRRNRVPALEAELAAALRERDELDARLVIERRTREELERRLAAEQAGRVALSDELRTVRAAHAALATELDGLRAQRDRLVAALGAARRAPVTAGAAGTAGSPSAAAPPTEAGTAGPTSPPAPASLHVLAAQQVAAAAARDATAAPPGLSSTSATVAADLERAAAALRARTAAPPERQDPAIPMSPASAATGTRPGAVTPVRAATPGAATAGGALIAARTPVHDRPGVTRVPAGGHALGDSPSLRAALARFAHGNPAAAGILLAGLLPAQGRIVSADLDYDLTIRGTGTYAVTLGGGTATVRSLAAPRRRAAADLQLTADPAALAALLAGSRRRVGRLTRELRFRGPRRALELLEPIVDAELSLAEAVRAGARLDPVAALLAMAVAVPAAWTRGHRFTVELVVDPGQSRRVYLHARDGAGLHAATSFGAEPDATIRLSSETFHALLRDERPAPGSRPHVRGDRGAVVALRGWAERVLGR